MTTVVVNSIATVNSIVNVVVSIVKVVIPIVLITILSPIIIPITATAVPPSPKGVLASIGARVVRDGDRIA